MGLGRGGGADFLDYDRLVVGESRFRRVCHQPGFRSIVSARDVRRMAPVAFAGWTRAELPADNRHWARGARAAPDVGVQRTMNGFPIITLITLAPILGGLIILGLGEQQK